MGKNNNNAKWTSGRSTVARVTSGTKANLAAKQKALHAPIKFLNSLFQKKQK
jgi:hypothetical protein